MLIAVRGEQLALLRIEGARWSIEQTDDHDRVVRVAHFDEDSLGAAVEELDARYIEGEGAQHSDRLTAINTALHGMEQTFLIRSIRFAGQASITTIENRGVDADGRAFEWVFHMVGQRDPTGRATGMEMFDEGDWDRALARFDELSQRMEP